MSSLSLHEHRIFPPLLTRPAPVHVSSLRIATFNVHCAKDPGAISRALNESENLAAADIVLLQEVESHPQEIFGRAEAIARKCGFNCTYMPARDAGAGGSHGLAILTRHALRNVREIPLSFCELAFVSRRRIGVACDLSIGSETIRIYNVHLDTRINIGTRIEQLQPILDDIARTPERKVILAGDFNTLPIRWMQGIIPVWYANHRHAIDSTLNGHGFSQRVEANGYTMRSGPIRFKLDSIYAKGLTIAASGAERDVRVSDHVPLWADIALCPALGEV